MKMKILIISKPKWFYFSSVLLTKEDIFKTKYDFHCMDINHIFNLEDLKYIK